MREAQGTAQEPAGCLSQSPTAVATLVSVRASSMLQHGALLSPPPVAVSVPEPRRALSPTPPQTPIPVSRTAPCHYEQLLPSLVTPPIPAPNSRQRRISSLTSATGTNSWLQTRRLDDKARAQLPPSPPESPSSLRVARGNSRVRRRSASFHGSPNISDDHALHESHLSIFSPSNKLPIVFRPCGVTNAHRNALEQQHQQDLARKDEEIAALLSQIHQLQADNLGLIEAATSKNARGAAGKLLSKCVAQSAAAQPSDLTTAQRVKISSRRRPKALSSPKLASPRRLEVAASALPSVRRALKTKASCPADQTTTQLPPRSREEPQLMVARQQVRAGRGPVRSRILIHQVKLVVTHTEQTWATATLQPSAQDVSQPSYFNPDAYGKLLRKETWPDNELFYSSLAAYTRISHERQAWYMEECMRITKMSLWRTAYFYMPELLNEYWSECSCMVKIGNQELHDQGLGYGFPGMKSNAVSQSITHESIKQLIDLRNDICHPRKNYTPKQTARMDELFGRCQSVAIALHDRDSAIKLHDVRCKLRSEAEEADKVFSLRLSSQTPDTIWDLPAERLFYNALRDPKDYDPVIVRAAQIWNQGGHPLSTGFPKSGHISQDDSYRRIPGQDDDYFKRLNMDRWDADTPEFRAVIKALGATAEQTAMSAKEMLEYVDGPHVPWVSKSLEDDQDHSWQMVEDHSRDFTDEGDHALAGAGARIMSGASCDEEDAGWDDVNEEANNLGAGYSAWEATHDEVEEGGVEEEAGEEVAARVEALKIVSQEWDSEEWENVTEDVETVEDDDE